MLSYFGQEKIQKMRLTQYEYLLCQNNYYIWEDI